jgi:hypothetical protein
VPIVPALCCGVDHCAVVIRAVGSQHVGMRRCRKSARAAAGGYVPERQGVNSLTAFAPTCRIFRSCKPAVPRTTPPERVATLAA